LFLNPFDVSDLNKKTPIQNVTEAKLGEKYMIPTEGIYLHDL